MEDYEVDLRDYVLVLWRWKWLIVAVVALAVGLAAGLTLAVPDTHRGDALVAFDVPRKARQAYPKPELDTLKLELTTARFLAPVVEDTDVSAGWLARELEVEEDNGMLRLTLETTLPAPQVERLLVGVVDTLDERLQTEFREAIPARLAEALEERRKLQEEIDPWHDRFADVKERAEDQRDALRQDIDVLREDPQLLGLELGDRLTLEGHLYRRELDLLYDRLERVEHELDKIDREGIAYLSGAERALENAEEELAKLADEVAALQVLEQETPRLIRLVRNPEDAARALRPNLRMNLAVAGVLGLFVGVLLAFFTEAMTKEREEA